MKISSARAGREFHDVLVPLKEKPYTTPAGVTVTAYTSTEINTKAITVHVVFAFSGATPRTALQQRCGKKPSLGQVVSMAK